ncbi:MAG: hypothetical protein IPK78_02445 [Rhodospirillales bacterium]|nr:hypothetical protein [Rhodospirillales bacterium]
MRASDILCKKQFLFIYIGLNDLLGSGWMPVAGDFAACGSPRPEDLLISSDRAAVDIMRAIADASNPDERAP